MPGRRRLAELRAGPPALYAGDTDSDVAFSPDGRVLAYARDDAVEVGDQDLDRVALWDVHHQRELAAFDAPGVQSLAFDATGELLAVGYGDRIELRDARSTALRQTIKSAETSVTQDLSFSPDGHLLAGSGVGGAFVWDISDLARVPVLAGTLVDREDVGSGGLASGLAFSPDGHHLAVADEGPEVIFWDLDPASWRAALCAMVDRDFSAQERGRFFPGGQPGPTCPG